MSNFLTDWQAEQEEEDRKRAEWNLGDYTGDLCPNCERLRICLCTNGKRRCEKCNWVIEDGSYCEWSLRV